MKRIVFDNGERISPKDFYENVVSAFPEDGGDLEILYDVEAGYIVISQPELSIKEEESHE